MTADLIASLIVIVAIFALRLAVLRFVNEHTPETSLERRRWTAAARNTTLILIAIGLVIIWSSALTTFALSLAAFVVAIVIATKELLLCIAGAAVRTSIDTVDIGDWVSISGLEGEVTENALLTTTIMCVDLHGGTYEYTGRQVAIPNSLFLTTPVHLVPRNDFVQHSFAITVAPLVDAHALIKKAKEFIDQESKSFTAEAAKAAKKINVNTVSDFPNPAPLVTLSTTEAGNQVIKVRWFCPLTEACRLEQNLRLAINKELKTDKSAT